MALDDILRSIRAGADAEVSHVRAAGDTTIAAIVARAGAEAADAERVAATSRDRDADREAVRIIDRARLEARRETLSAVEDGYQESLDVLRTRLRTMRGTDAYPDVFERLLDEALSVLPHATRADVDPADAALARTLLVDRGRSDIVVEPTLSCAGGLDVASDHERTVRNTFESRLERADGRLRGLVAAHVSNGISG